MTIDSKPPEMSAATKEVLGRVRRMIPPMLNHFHKGQMGRVGVLGGSEDYTGAPYFSAMASARLGCDMSHVICTPAAAAVIKTYSPNLMVHPLMRQSPPRGSTVQAMADKNSKDPDEDPEDIAAAVAEMLPRLHVLVIGPGLGRDPLMQETVARVLRSARERNLPVVLDADALLLVQKDPSLVRGYGNAVITPNVVEFGRLCKALGVEEQVARAEDKGGETARVEALAKALEGVTVIQKGGVDYISNGTTTLAVDLPGGRKRSGGQGDTMTGSVATFLGWRKAYLDGIWDRGDDLLSEEEMLGLAAFGGSAITRECSRLAFAKKGRSLQASDLTDEVHNAFMNLFGEIDEDAGGSKL
ncbi:YjeF domain-containing protein [Sodiomyces alkalinus F11]|uniref:ATP-dependent (S)-NAD(P)H-hydrate dehydratase n=1 Tax=Sodiomyces alkalinus (strain CBS 110278 / VKM F-3762 / F11) TaxID=1314773 RepID=A0A3N2PRR7_SODAK|nr:YjeF domain-containing protein [Sodiomyces alkalinus F11]ROT37209.1 YjeF domain-containing protein [Sodiomyces alkalinus F11]